MTESTLELEVAPTVSVFEALQVLEGSAKQIVLVCDADRRLLGTLTDGDIRRAILRGCPLHETPVGEVMHTGFLSVHPWANRAEVLDMMRSRGIAQVPILDDDRRLLGLHTLREMIVPVKRPNAAVVMAGGKGTRLRPLTETVPKPMIPVAGRPMLERIVLHLVGSGIRDVYLSINYLGHIIEDHFGDGSDFGCNIRYLRESRPLGTGGCLSLLEERPAAPLLVMNGDLVTQIDVGRFVDFHADGGYTATLAVRPYRTSIPFGVVDVDGTEVVGLREKPTEQVLVNAGMYVLSPEALGLVPEGAEFPITELFVRSLDERRRVGAYLVEEDWADVGRPEELLRANGQL